MYSCQSSHFQKVDGEGYVCQIEKNGDVCRAKLGSKLFNLKRHIETHHPDIFKSIAEEEQAKKQAVVQKSSTSNRRFQNTFRVKKLLCQWQKKNSNTILFNWLWRMECL